MLNSTTLLLAHCVICNASLVLLFAKHCFCMERVCPYWGDKEVDIIVQRLHHKSMYGSSTKEVNRCVIKWLDVYVLYVLILFLSYTTCEKAYHMSDAKHFSDKVSLLGSISNSTVVESPPRGNFVFSETRSTRPISPTGGYVYYWPPARYVVNDATFRHNQECTLPTARRIWPIVANLLRTTPSQPRQYLFWSHHCFHWRM